LAAKPAEAAHPGTNGSVIFSSTRDGDADIFKMNTDGTGVTQLVNSPGLDNEPSIGPGGKSFVFVSNRDGDKEIYVQDLDGTNLKQLTTNTTDDNFPKWANDNVNAGREIAYKGIDPSGTDAEIFTVGTELVDDDAESGGQTIPEPFQITFNAVNDDRPTYNATSGTMFWNQNESTTSSRDRIVKATRDLTTGEFGTQTAITPAGAPDETSPDVSPDGTKVLYVEGTGAGSDIYRMNADGTGRAAVIVKANKQQHPTYFPDGLKLTYTDSAVGNEDVFTANALTGASKTNITNNSAADDHGEVQPVVPTSTITPTLLIHEDPTMTSTHSVEVSFSKAGSYVAGDTFECKLDSGAWAACTSPYANSSVPNGSHTLYVRAITNGVPETTPAETSWDYTGPDPEDAPPPPLAMTAPVLHFVEYMKPVGELMGLQTSLWAHHGSPRAWALTAGHYQVVSKLYNNPDRLFTKPTVCDNAPDHRQGGGWYYRNQPGRDYGDFVEDNNGVGAGCADPLIYVPRYYAHKATQWLKGPDSGVSYH
jgi:TolB protein